MEHRDIVCAKSEDALNGVDKIFNAFSGSLKRQSSKYDRYDGFFFSVFRKLIVRWNGFLMLLKNDQCENADVFMRTIFELQISLEFIFLESEIDMINNRIAAYQYNTLLEQIKATYSQEEQKKARGKLHSDSIYLKVQNDIDNKKVELGRYKYFWANVYCDKKMGNFNELIEYVNNYCFSDLDSTWKNKLDSGFTNIMKHRYKTLSTELHSNNLRLRNKDMNFYQSNYTKSELFFVEDALVQFDTVIGDFISYLLKKYELPANEQETVEELRSEVLNAVLK